jgi:hypothetical protein
MLPAVLIGLPVLNSVVTAFSRLLEIDSPLWAMGLVRLS